MQWVLSYKKTLETKIILLTLIIKYYIDTYFKINNQTICFNAIVPLHYFAYNFNTDITAIDVYIYIYLYTIVMNVINI